MQKKRIYFSGVLERITPPEVVTLSNGRTFTRSLLTVRSEDDQLAFFEARESVLKFIEFKNIKVGSKVTIGFVMQGSIRGEKTFNNLFANYLTEENEESK